MEEEQRSNVFNLRSINQVIIQTPCDPYVTYIQDYMAIHYFDRSMVNASIVLSLDIMVDRLIGNIKWYIWLKGIFNNYKWKAPLGNSGPVGEEVGNSFGKGKRDVDGKNSGLWFFGPTTHNKEIPHRFDLKTPKEAFMHILYGYIICKAEIYHREYMGSYIHRWIRLSLCSPHAI